MKNQLKFLAFNKFFFCFILGISSGLVAAQKVDVDIEKVKAKCKDKKYEERLRVTVARFSVSTPTATKEFGDNLATMLTNALHEINCFRVLESTKNLEDMTDEISLGQEGYTNGSSPQGGSMLGAQVVFTGEITEFNEGQSGTGFAGIKMVKNKAKVGFIIKAINPETRDIYFSKSIETESDKPGGFNGVKVLGIEMAGSSKNNGAIADAIERGIIKAVYEIGENIDKLPFPKATSSVVEKKVWNQGNCPLLASGASPTVMVIVPENYNYNDYRNYNFSDLAVETAIIRKFTESGFTVIDPAMYAAKRKDANFNEALRNPMAAASIGSDFGADIVIVGDASSSVTSKSPMVSCRARVDAKAIGTKNSSILATNGFDAGATDVAENSSSKKALGNAGEMIADYIIERMCSNSTSIGGVGGNANSGQAYHTTSLALLNVNFSKVKSITDILLSNKSVKSAKRTSLEGSQGTVEVTHENSTDELADFLMEKGGHLFEITGMTGNTLTVVAK
jgi:curli biogenesis system outer membrane secretion channel CsgG